MRVGFDHYVVIELRRCASIRVHVCNFCRRCVGALINVVDYTVFVVVELRLRAAVSIDALARRCVRAVIRTIGNTVAIAVRGWSAASTTTSCGVAGVGIFVAALTRLASTAG